MARFFIEGLEIEVNDLSFHIPEERIDQAIDALKEVKEYEYDKVA